MKPPKITFTKSGKAFLDSYFPKDKMFTSKKEVKKIADTFFLWDKSLYELSGLRNAVVEYYRDKIDENFDYMSSMQSITAVIDHFKIRQGGQV